MDAEEAKQEGEREGEKKRRGKGDKEIRRMKCTRNAIERYQIGMKIRKQ